MALTKEAAVKILFNQGFEQKEIARILRISEVTISKYVTQGDLRRKRLDHSIKKNTAEEDALTSLAHQSKIIRMISDKLGVEITEESTIEQLKAALIPKGEIDALQKLFTTIKGKELEWSAIVRITREFTTFIKERNPELAQDVVDFGQEFIDEKRRLM